ncbi:dTDP-4-dehydrorhamnose 3,5-epimerase [Portibacter marinus]|uniref:dTDP-4-dehydrorhamnose 3,5-epimerase n=1 Tax=Portibacter marinus TaxID=2898660 RepID=UPI001F48B524|nr:dTDP-4-dehydrorhamnose 3,5-epimerase [Portibacter marinus]
MEIIETGIAGLKVLKPIIHGDHRGYFFESYNKSLLEESELQIDFIQDNEAMSHQKIFRGFHYQLPPFGQTKLVRVVHGAVFDVVIDIRPGSSTYGETYAIELSSENKLQLLVPKGFAHGYLCLEDHTIFSYKVDAPYHFESEKGISYLDPSLNIEWPQPPSKFIVSQKDKVAPPLGSHVAYE